MLNWAPLLLVAAMFAAVLGFSGRPAGAAWIPQILCFLLAAAFAWLVIRAGLNDRPRLRL
jgi:uncharacterized membrane protein YtjA (UPF0391 family)